MKTRCASSSVIRRRFFKSSVSSSTEIAPVQSRSILRNCSSMSDISRADIENAIKPHAARLIAFSDAKADSCFRTLSETSPSQSLLPRPTLIASNHAWCMESLALGRSSGSSANRCATNSLASCDTPSQRGPSRGNPFIIISLTISLLCWPTNGREPLSSKYMITPNAQTSHFLSTIPSHISGAMYAAVPSMPASGKPLKCIDSPKSMSFNFASSEVLA
mmetsp:Transcript_89145/g.260611  ORF Transcript_89145/g.260611 Transcript_89145/m.260611 type:complete len:219 (-) Transcript_89145:684-1340(-)